MVAHLNYTDTISVIAW